eukprot:scaffold37817_cov48-Prasinocladus_malaysianus.AAC.1
MELSLLTTGQEGSCHVVDRSPGRKMLDRGNGEEVNDAVTHARKVHRTGLSYYAHEAEPDVLASPLKNRQL